MNHARVRTALSIIVLGVSHVLADDAPATFLTEPQANVQAVPSDPPAVSISADDGRYVAFTSYARLSPGDTNDHSDIYVLDRITHRLTLETPPSDERIAEGGSGSPHLSGDGHFLVYETTAVAQSRTDAVRLLMLRDRLTGAPRPIAPAGVSPNGNARNATISADGHTVVFASSSTNLTGDPDANGSADDVYRFDVASGSISRISLDSSSRQSPLGSSFAPSVSADGRYVAFSSTAPLDGPTMPSRDGRPPVDVYVRDLTSSVTTRVSARSDGTRPNGSSYDAAISGDGRYVAFVSDATNLAGRDANRAPDIYLFDAKTRTTELVSRSEGGGAANGASSHPAISTAGTMVTFQSDASDLTCPRRCPAAVRDINLVPDIFVFDRRTRVMRRVSTGPASWMEASIGPAIDGTGAVIAFSSRHPRDQTDDGGDYDLFVRAPIK